MYALIEMLWLVHAPTTLPSSPFPSIHCPRIFLLSHPWPEYVCSAGMNMCKRCVCERDRERERERDKDGNYECV